VVGELQHADMVERVGAGRPTVVTVAVAPFQMMVAALRAR